MTLSFFNGIVFENRGMPTFLDTSSAPFPTRCGRDFSDPRIKTWIEIKGRDVRVCVKRRRARSEGGRAPSPIRRRRNNVVRCKRCCGDVGPTPALENR